MKNFINFFSICVVLSGCGLINRKKKDSQEPEPVVTQYGRFKVQISNPTCADYYRTDLIELNNSPRYVLEESNVHQELRNYCPVYKNKDNCKAKAFRTPSGDASTSFNSGGTTALYCNKIPASAVPTGIWGKGLFSKDGVIYQQEGLYKKTLYLLDFFEGCMEHKMESLPLRQRPYIDDHENGGITAIGKEQKKYILSPMSVDPHDLVDEIIAELAKVDPNRAALYQTKLDSFMANAEIKEFKQDPAAFDLPDAPDDCVFVQVSAGRAHTTGDYANYRLSEEFFKMPADDQAGLMLHEIIGAEATALGKDVQRNIRYFTAWLATHKNYSADEYKAVLAKIGFPETVQPF